MGDGIEKRVESSGQESQLETSVAFRYAGITEKEWDEIKKIKPDMERIGYPTKIRVKAGIGI